MLRVILILALFVSCASHAGILAQKSSSSQPANPLSVITNSFVFTHPGTLNSDADFQTIKYQINNSISPRTSFYAQLTANTSCTTAYVDHPVSLIVSSNPEGDNFVADLQAAYCLAVRFVITGNSAYATHAEQILTDWSILQPPGTLGLNWYLNLAWTGETYAETAELLSSYDHTWTPTAQLPVKQVLNNIFLPVLHKRYAMWNRQLIVAAALGAIGVYLEDPAALYEAVYRYMAYVPEFIYDTGDGALPNTLTVFNGWYSSTIGAYDPFDQQMMALHAGRLCSGCTDWITLSIPYQALDPTTVANANVTGEVIRVGDGSTTTFTHYTNYVTVSPSSVTVSAGSVTATDNGSGVLTGSGVTAGSINYASGVLAVNFATPPASGTTVSVSYQYPKQNQNTGGIGLPVTVTPGTPALFTGVTTQNGTSVYVKASLAGAVLPSGLSLTTQYCVMNSSGNTFNLSLYNSSNSTCPGPAIATTTAGNNVSVSFDWGDDISVTNQGIQQQWSAPEGCGFDGAIIAVGPIISGGSGYSNGYNANSVVTGGTGHLGTLNMTVGGTATSTTTAAQASGTTIVVSSTSGMAAGYAITDATTTSAIPSGTTISSISGSTITLSATATGVLKGDTINVTVPSGVVSNVYGVGANGTDPGGYGYTVGDVISTSSFGGGTTGSGFQVAVTQVCQWAHTFIPGYSQEIFRDLGHADASLNHIEDLAEIAWHQGLDLYTPMQSRLLKYDEVMSYYLMGGTMNPAAYNGYNAPAVSAVSGTREILTNHLVNILGYPTTGTCSMPPTTGGQTSLPCTAEYITTYVRNLDPNLAIACPYSSPFPTSSCPGATPSGLLNPFATHLQYMCYYEACFQPLTHGQLNGSLP